MATTISCRSIVITALCDFTDIVKTTTAGTTEGEPWLDPKYLPPDPPATTAVDEKTREAPAPILSYSSITPGVLKTQRPVGGGVGRPGVGGAHGGAIVSGKLKPATLASSYFPKS